MDHANGLWDLVKISQSAFVTTPNLHSKQIPEVNIQDVSSHQVISGPLSR